MTLIGTIVAIIAIALLLTGGFLVSLNFLLWIGIALAVVAAIVFLVRYIGAGQATR